MPSASGLGEPCLQNADCANGFTCTSGKCELPANLGGCEPSRKRCNGADVEQCTADGLGYDVVTTCATGCSGGACRPLACTPGARRCEGDAAEACTPAGDAWALVQFCPSHCDPGSGDCLARACTPFSTRCSADNGSVLTCDSFGAVYVATPCGSAQVCDQGRCAAVVCGAGQTRCSASGTAVEACSALGDAWATVQACRYDCASGTTGAACLPAACASGSVKCEGNALEACLPDQTGYGFVTFCATGCDSAAGACKAPVCAPLSRKCADATHVEVCADDGGGYTVLPDACPQGCAGGECATSSAGCNPGDLRCNGADAQQCAAVPGSPGVTAWSTQTTCLAGCSSGACLPGGSCTKFTLHAAAAAAPSDGASTVLLYSDPIVGAGGVPLPDGLVFNVTASSSDGSAATLLEGGVAQPGSVQVTSLGGLVRAVLRAPASGSVVTATASLAQGASCSGAATVTFAPPSGAQVTLVADDFTDPSHRNLAQTSATWDTGRGAIGAAWPLSTGGGEDGPLAVTSANTPYNLSASGFMPSFTVVGLSAQGAVIDGIAQGLSGGDEVILWDAQGSASASANAGNYELLHVLSVQGAQVTFVEKVALSYGVAADQDVAAQRVVLQRVPHFSSLFVDAGATLTASAWGTAPGGLLFVRVGCPAPRLQIAGTCDGVALVLGDLNLDGAGFRGGVPAASCSAPAGSFGAGEDATGRPSAGASGGGAQSCGGGYGSPGFSPASPVCAPGQPYGLPLLGKLFLGAGGGSGNACSVDSGGSGGGAIVLSAQAIAMTNTAAQQGHIHADGVASGGSGAGGGGAGGSLWLSAPTLTLGSATALPFASARGGTPARGGAGGNGRIRLDYQNLDVSLRFRPQPANAAGAISGPLAAQSQIVFAASSSQQIASAQLVTALAPGDAAFSVSAALGALDFGSVVPGGTRNFLSAGSPLQGPSFVWRVQLTPAPGAPEQVLGLQWALTVH